MKIIKAFEVIRGDGSVWAAYCYQAMAEYVAKRCNSDAALAKAGPYTVRVEYA